MLERELAHTKETLQATVEELETSNEELQSTNEELVASNEELQSTNEELQSVNEELHTVNSEHQQKISELTNLTTDINNLLQCSRVGTVFLDRSFVVKKFTPAAQDVFHLIELDIGRPLEHIASKFVDVDVMDVVRRAMDSNQSVEVQVKHTSGDVYLLNCFPHADDAPVAGIVVQTVSLATLVHRTEAESP
ncbi:MAG: PAS domain-containing protein [Planctomycetota bacterium]